MPRLFPLRSGRGDLIGEGVCLLESWPRRSSSLPPPPEQLELPPPLSGTVCSSTPAPHVLTGNTPSPEGWGLNRCRATHLQIKGSPNFQGLSGCMCRALTPASLHGGDFTRTLHAKYQMPCHSCDFPQPLDEQNNSNSHAKGRFMNRSACRGHQLGGIPAGAGEEGPGAADAGSGAHPGRPPLHECLI